MLFSLERESTPQAAPVPPSAKPGGFAGGGTKARFLLGHSCAGTPRLRRRGGSLLKMGAYLLLTCIALPFFAVISLFFIQETRRALDVALGFSLLTFLCSVGL